MLLVISFAWFFLTTPYGILSVTRNQFPEDQKSLTRFIIALTFLLFYLNHSVNFYLYCLTGQKIRNEFLDLFLYVCKRSRRRYKRKKSTKSPANDVELRGVSDPGRLVGCQALFIRAELHHDSRHCSPMLRSPDSTWWHSQASSDITHTIGDRGRLVHASPLWPCFRRLCHFAWPIAVSSIINRTEWGRRLLVLSRRHVLQQYDIWFVFRGMRTRMNAYTAECHEKMKYINLSCELDWGHKFPHYLFNVQVYLILKEFKS